MQAWNRFTTQGSVQQLHEGIWRTWSHGTSEIPRWENVLLLPHYPIFLETSSTASTWIALMEVPSLLTAPNNKTDESQPGTEFSIILTRIQGPTSKWKTSVGNIVTIIHEETSSAIRRHVPPQSNPADLIWKGIEPSALPHHGGRDTTGHHRNFQAGLPQRSLLQTTWKSEVHVALLQPRSHYTRTFQGEITHQSLQLQQILHHLQTSKPTGKWPLCPHKILTRRRLAVWRWYNKFLIHKKGIDGTKGWSHHFSQDHAFIQQLGGSLTGGGQWQQSVLLIKQCIRWFTTKSSQHKMGCLSRKHKVSSCWATTNSLIK